MRSLGFVTKQNGQYMVVGQPPVGPPPHIAVLVALPPLLPGLDIATSAHATSSVLPPAPETVFPTPPTPPADSTNLHLTLSEIQHIQRFQGA